jgi:molybdopterin-containing oxidoreductase family iron-sulfur binding subunit
MDHNANTEKTVLAEMRAKLAGKTGKRYWRSLEEVSDSAEFQRFLDDEFPNRSTLLQINRRDLLKFMGASMAMAGLAGCRGVFLPEDKVVPYVKQPEELVPGEPLFYASTITLGGYGTGVLVEQHEGRPIQINGNPDHPASLGSLDVLSQAQVLSLYDPDRPASVTQLGDDSTWPAFEQALESVFKESPNGEGVRILTGAITSPTLDDLLRRFLAKYPQAAWYVHEPCGRVNPHIATKMIYGLGTGTSNQALNTYYNFREAKVVVSLDSDFLSPSENPGSVRYARDFANGRRVQGKSGEMNRLYSIHSSVGLVPVMADHRWPVKANDVQAVAAALAAAVGVAGAEATGVPSHVQGAIQAIANDLKSHAGASIVIAGDHLSANVHVLAAAINQALGNVGKTVLHTVPVESKGVWSDGQDLSGLTGDMQSGAVKALFIIDCNPAYTAPADVPFADAVKKVKFVAQLGSNEDETSELVEWHLPMSHELEAWGDARAFDGTASIAQPLIAPLFDSRSPIEFVGTLLGKRPVGYELVRAYWKGKLPGDFEKSWRHVVHDGIVKGSAFPVVAPTLLERDFAKYCAAPPSSEGLEVVFRADPSIYDGRYANNGWLQELPKPITKIAWDNAVIVSPAFAQSQGLVSDDKVKLDVNGANITAPVFVQPGHPDGSVTVHLGFGRAQGGVVATVSSEREGGGFNAYVLRKRGTSGFVSGATLTRLGGQSEIASTQGHSPLNGDRIIDDRDVVRAATLAEFLSKGEAALVPEDAATEEWTRNQSMFPEEIFEWDGPQWGMTIDLNTCIGCNACVIACQSENNIPVVGKEQVARHREMHWIRIDRYYSGDESNANPDVTWQPVMCVHCEKAPCEPVCPVAATVHSHEGLNQMVYNRCVGTRYCSNNCPYKVRRFNYLNYSDNQPNFSDQLEGGVLNQSLIPGPLHTPRKEGLALLRLLNNPDVTVRGRGVMEKCTYCVQRINAARIEAKKAGREIHDGEIVTACQQACPTQTIVFGNIADGGSTVSRLKADPRSYKLLEELQTRPRTSHLAKLRNPNPEIKA